MCRAVCAQRGEERETCGGRTGWCCRVGGQGETAKKASQGCCFNLSSTGDACSTGEDGWPARFASSLARDFAGYFGLLLGSDHEEKREGGQGGGGVVQHCVISDI